MEYTIITNMCTFYNFDAGGPEKPLINFVWPKVLKDTFDLNVRVVKFLETCSVLVACISLLPFITVLVLLLKREGNVAINVL